MSNQKKKAQTKQTIKEIRREQRAAEREIFQKLHGKQKLIHFLMYYRWWVIGICLGIFVVVSFAMAFVNGSGKIGLYCTVFTDSTEDYEAWGEERISQAGPLDGDGFFEQLAYFSSEDDILKGVAESYLATRIGVQEADVFVGGEYFFEYAGNELGVLMPLTELFGAQELKKYEDRLVCTADGIPRAIALTEDEFADAAVKPYYIMVCSASSHPEQSAKFILATLKE